MRPFAPRRVLLTLSLLAAVVVPASSGHAGTPAFRSVDGLEVLSVHRLDPRSYNVRVLSADLGRPVDIRILLPAHYTAHRRYPVFYLFHGTSGRASDWETLGGAEKTTAPYDVI